MIQFLQGRNMYPKFRRVRSYAASENAIFHKLVDVLQERIQLQDARGVAGEAQENMLQVDNIHVCCLNNASNIDLQCCFQHSGETISRHLGAVLKAIVQFTGSLIQVPPVNTPLKVSNNLMFMPYS